MSRIRLSTEVKITPLPFLDYKNDRHVVLLGSCFTQNIGSRLGDAQFRALVNPYGTIFNPYSLSQIIKHAVNDTLPGYGNLVVDGRCVNYLYHSDMSSDDEFSGDMLCSINYSNVQLVEAVRNSNWLVLTLGTAWVYEHKEVGIVGNCHKQPDSLFTRRCLDVLMVKQCMIEAIQAVRRVNTDIKILFTVSPVRHARDGMRENAVSKATLILAVDELVRTMPDVYYFPAYEILLDELRDYRFYAADMLHPSEVAVDIIWDRLQQAWFSPEDREIMRYVVHSTKKLTPVRDPCSIERYRFVCDLMSALGELSKKYHIDFAQEQDELLAEAGGICSMINV